MADFVDFIPLLQETIDTVRARLDSDVNAGVDPSSQSFVDTTEGGFYWDLTQAVALEIERLWDFAATEVAAVAFPPYAWGEYLDDHAETLGLARKEATAAGGDVRFAGREDTLISPGTEVATAPTDADSDPIVFTTTAEAIIPALGVVDVPVAALDSGSQGNVLANNVSVLVSPISGVSAVSNPSAITGGADVESDEDLRDRVLLQLSTAQGAGTVADYERWALSFPGVGVVSVTPLWDGPGTVHVVVADPSQNPVNDTTKWGLQDYLDPPRSLTRTTSLVDLPTGTISVVSTAGFAASGTIMVETEAVAYTGVTDTSFTGCTGGTDEIANGGRVAQGFSEGRGVAPIGATVTVDTITVSAVTVASTVTFDSRHSLDGDGGTIPTRAQIEDEIIAYLDGLKPGESAVLKRVESRFFRVPGVTDIANTRLNGDTRNVSVDATEVVTAGSITLT